MRPNTLTLLLSTALGAGGQLLLKYAVRRGSSAAEGFLPVLLQAVRSGYFWTGLVLFGTSFLLWLWVLTGMELSRAYPCVSLSYLVVFVLSVLLFHETVTLGKVVGILTILVGVGLINL